MWSDDQIFALLPEPAALLVFMELYGEIQLLVFLHSFTLTTSLLSGTVNSCFQWKSRISDRYALWGNRRSRSRPKLELKVSIRLDHISLKGVNVHNLFLLPPCGQKSCRLNTVSYIDVCLQQITFICKCICKFTNTFWRNAVPICVFIVIIVHNYKSYIMLLNKECGKLQNLDIGGIRKMFTDNVFHFFSLWYTLIAALVKLIFRHSQHFFKPDDKLESKFCFLYKNPPLGNECCRWT